jgi:hypothetical protein
MLRLRRMPTVRYGGQGHADPPSGWPSRAGTCVAVRPFATALRKSAQLSLLKIRALKAPLASERRAKASIVSAFGPRPLKLTDRGTSYYGSSNEGYEISLLTLAYLALAVS